MSWCIHMSKGFCIGYDNDVVLNIGTRHDISFPILERFFILRTVWKRPKAFHCSQFAQTHGVIISVIRAVDVAMYLKIKLQKDNF